MALLTSSGIRALILVPVLGLAACAQSQGSRYDPRLGMHVAADGQVYPSLSGNAAGLRLGLGPGGGSIGTGLGPIRLSAGF